MTDYTEPIPGVFTVSLYDAASCRDFIRCANAVDRWEGATVQAESAPGDRPWIVAPEVRKATTLPLSYAPAIAQQFDTSLRQIIVPLVHRRWELYIPDHAGAQIVRYFTGGHYKVHTDWGEGMEHRLLTILCYLNDDFTGGATCFPQFDYSETPQCGKAVVFPSEYRHGAEPVVSGCKYTLVTWLVGPRQIDGI